MNQMTDSSAFALLASEAGFDPIEDRLRASVRATIEALFEAELAAFLGRLRYGRGGGQTKGYRHGHHVRQLTGTFGTETLRVPRARVEAGDGKVTEWRSKALPRYQRLTKTAEALIASVYLAGTNTRRVKRALFGLFQGAVGKDVVSRAWRKVRSTGRRGAPAAGPGRTSSGSSSTARSSRRGSTARPRTSRCWPPSACAGTARRSCWPSRTWAGRARRPGASSSPI
jgi:hypothetical protein